MPSEKALLSGPVAAILSAALFGLSPVFCKVLIGDMSPALLAGLLYLGSGLGLSGVIVYQRSTTPVQIGGALLIGALSYGLSLVLFVEALRRIGSARTSTFFAVGPFIGTAFAVLILGERLPLPFLFAAILMLAGVAILYGEQHRHLHSHPATAHRHRHEHDAHHQHEHGAGDELAVDHYHEHDPLTHLHAHWPDVQHRHSH